MNDYHCESLDEHGVRYGGFVVRAVNMADALSQASRNIEVAIRPEMHTLRVSLLKR